MKTKRGFMSTDDLLQAGKIQFEQLSISTLYNHISSGFSHDLTFLVNLIYDVTKFYDEMFGVDVTWKLRDHSYMNDRFEITAYVVFKLHNREENYANASES